MTRIAIVEDEAAVREQLAGYVQRYTRQYGTPFEVTEFADGMEILEDYRPQFDIIFLDVEMKHLDGMDSLLSIVQMPAGVPVATTAINGAKNAALIAVSILALQDAGLAAKLDAFRAKQTADVLKAEL